MLMDETSKEFIQYVMHVSELEEKCPCPKLFRLALDYGMTLEDLRNELWKLTRMPEWEVKKYNVKPYKK